MNVSESSYGLCVIRRVGYFWTSHRLCMTWSKEQVADISLLSTTCLPFYFWCVTLIYAKTVDIILVLERPGYF